ncbi:MAG: hypothetical protein V2I46_04465 [Bacteroides sp.]|jgi:hypothetical protein|nr:hypothetical protein [Bacteroides sp.]
MKTPGILFLIVFASLFSLTACEDWLDVKKTFTFEHEFPVTSDDLSFQESEVIDMPLKNSLIKDYGSKIKKIEILEVRYWLTYHEGSETQQYNNISLNVAKADGSDSKNISTLQNVVLSPLLNNPTVLPTNEEGTKKLSDLIKNPPHKLSLKIVGDINEVPVNFKVYFEFDVRMTASPL